MSLGSLHVRIDTFNLGLERRDPLLQLVDRQGVEILLAQRDQRIVRLTWKEIVQVHR